MFIGTYLNGSVLSVNQDGSALTFNLVNIDAQDMNSIVLDSQHNFIAASSSTGLIAILDAESGTFLRKIQDSQFPTVELATARVSPDGSTILVPDQGCIEEDPNSGACTTRDGISILSVQ
ncbi:MAG: hypothetical protein JST54_15230 [Deltaproteobacteria bacterium]|nr:hypothetical protein [Deltaproteobacteria bacterium]